jgi:photosystem II stability/assembly factor-like uncharacterized protein
MRRASLIALFGVSAIALASASCNKRYSGSGGGGGGGGSSWLVGQYGTMIRYSHDDQRFSRYNIPVRFDLFAIACRGEQEAWVAGDQGTVLKTLDGGATWQVVPTTGTATLRAVAVASEGGVFVAGDGTLRYTADSGAHWRSVDVAGASLTSVATTAAGDIALLTSADGKIFRYQVDSDRLTPVAQTDGIALRTVTVTADGRRAVAAGDHGLFLVSTDGARSFGARDLGTTRALERVWLTQTGERSLAVGEGGVIVDLVGTSAPRIEERLQAPAMLRAMHMSADGNGLAVGDNGAAFTTEDGGQTWTPVSLGTTATLYGVDALHGEPHL